MSPSPFLPRPLRASRMLGLFLAGSLAVVVLAIIGMTLARRFSTSPAPAAQAQQLWAVGWPAKNAKRRRGSHFYSALQ